MARPLRFIPTGALVEVTLRTVHGRLLLRPGRRLSDLVVGVLGRAQRIFSPLPCWSMADAEPYRERVAAIVRRIVEDCRQQRGGRAVLGKRAILAQDPHDRPLHSNRPPAPAVHAASKEIRVMLRAAYWRFADAFREAAHRLGRGDRLVPFPPGAFPPPIPCAAPTG